MDRELRELHRGAREERRKLTPDPSPNLPPRADADEKRCDHTGCDDRARHRVENPLAGGRNLHVCPEHLPDADPRGGL